MRKRNNKQKEETMAKIPRSADMLVNLILSRPGEIEKLKNNPEKTLRELAKETTTDLIPPVLKREAGIYYIVVSAIGLVAILAIIGAVILSLASLEKAIEVKIPDIVTALGSAAIGALAGLLSPSPRE